MKIKLDENVHGDVVEALRSHGHDVLSVHDESPQFWLNAQLAVDIYRASKRLKKVPKPLPMAG